MPKSQRWWLTTDSQEIIVRATPEAVYDMVADLPRMGEWSPECQAVEWETGTTGTTGTTDTTGPAEGARFVGHNRGGPANLMRWSRHGRVLAAERGRAFSFITEEGGREGTQWQYRFEAAEGGTRVTETYVVTWIPTWARIVDVPTNRHRELLEGMRHTLEQLKEAAEHAGDEAGRR